MVHDANRYDSWILCEAARLSMAIPKGLKELQRPGIEPEERDLEANAGEEQVD
jgi:hypothetical protein